jgi:lipopolysaccharide export system protein LptA
MFIEANEVELDDQTGISVYRGDVKVTQGTLVLTGDHMTVHSRKGDIEKVILLGTPATYRQRPDDEEEDRHAEALRMEYYAEPERIILLQEAVTWQGKDVFRSDRIVYEMESDRVSAGSPEGDQRVRITIQPRSQEATPQDGGPE